MNENPYSPPKQTETQSVDEEKIRDSIKKLKRARALAPLAIVVVGASTAAEYAGVFRSGFLPKWFGIALVALFIVQIPLQNAKIKKLENQLNQNA